MAKVIKKMNLSAESSTEVNEAVLKGTPENPYTQEEMTTFGDGTWPGGFVEGMGYLPPSTIGVGSSGSGSDDILYDNDDMQNYVGIYVSQGSSEIEHYELPHGFAADLVFGWGNGFTGTKPNNSPNWQKSELVFNSLSIYVRDLNENENETTVYTLDHFDWDNEDISWVKICRNSYKIVLHVKYTIDKWSKDENGNRTHLNKQTLEYFIEHNDPSFTQNNLV